LENEIKQKQVIEIKLISFERPSSPARTADCRKWIAFMGRVFRVAVFVSSVQVACSFVA
jgi:hypothetical protein